MNRIGYMLVTLGVLTGGLIWMSFAPARADGAAAPVFDVKMPAGYRDWKLISVAHEEGSLNDLRAVLGNDIAIKAYREGRLPLATLVAALARVGTAINPALGFMAFTMFLLFAVHAILTGDGGSAPHLLETRLYDVTVDCIIALVGTLAATYPRFTPRQNLRTSW
jgi:hypothetical protein